MCLNPCCGGRCSSTFKKVVDELKSVKVLILVVVEDVLVQIEELININNNLKS